MSFSAKAYKNIIVCVGVLSDFPTFLLPFTMQDMDEYKKVLCVVPILWERSFCRSRF